MVKKCICAGSIIIKGNKILLLKHHKLGIWLYPGGHVDENETPVDAAIREAKEETGYKIKLIGRKDLNFNEKGVAVEMPLPLCTLYETVPYKTGTHMHFDLAYLAKPVGKKGPVSEHESQKLKWFSEGEIARLNTFTNVKAVLRLAFKTAKVAK